MKTKIVSRKSDSKNNTYHKLAAALTEIIQLTIFIIFLIA